MKTAKEVYMIILGESTIQTDSQVIENAMIEFAKMHVQVALKIASENYSMKIRNNFNELDMNDDWMEIDKTSILKAYPPENIV